MTMALLEIRDLHTYYGKIHALRGVSLTVGEDEIVTLIGANGAGKTTTLNTVSGLLVPKEGSVHFDGEDVTHVAPHDMVTRGVVQVPEGRRIFAQLTVEENLHMGAFTVDDKAMVEEGVENAFTMVPRLKERRSQVAGTLSGGEQQMLAIGRALMTKPRILLMDEPSMGLAPNLVEHIFETVQRIHAEGTAILLVEQNAATALTVASRGYVLQTGQILLADSADGLAANEDVKRSYLGEI
jgi:branched-chain amino acid transport system ATP-binding protein